MVNFVRFGKRGGRRDLFRRGGRKMMAVVVMAVSAAYPALADAKPKVASKTKALLGCWQKSGEMSCWDNRLASWAVNLCFSANARVYALRTNGCVGEGLGDTEAFKSTHGRITFIHAIHNRRRIAKVVYQCRMSTISSTQVQFFCGQETNFYDGTWTKLCSRTNADGTTCADKNEILPRKGWEAAVEYLPGTWSLP